MISPRSLPAPAAAPAARSSPSRGSTPWRGHLKMFTPRTFPMFMTHRGRRPSQGTIIGLKSRFRRRSQARRGGRVVEGTRLLIWRTGNGTEGSNPSLSAIKSFWFSCILFPNATKLPTFSLEVFVNLLQSPSQFVFSADRITLVNLVAPAANLPRHASRRSGPLEVTGSGAPARSKLRAADLRKSWIMRPGSPAFSQARFHSSRKPSSKPRRSNDCCARAASAQRDARGRYLPNAPL
jgi:hypothetical protein